MCESLLTFIVWVFNEWKFAEFELCGWKKSPRFSDEKNCNSTFFIRLIRRCRKRWTFLRARGTRRIKCHSPFCHFFFFFGRCLKIVSSVFVHLLNTHSALETHYQNILNIFTSLCSVTLFKIYSTKLSIHFAIIQLMFTSLGRCSSIQCFSSFYFLPPFYLLKQRQSVCISDCDANFYFISFQKQRKANFVILSAVSVKKRKIIFWKLRAATDHKSRFQNDGYACTRQLQTVARIVRPHEFSSLSHPNLCGRNYKREISNAQVIVILSTPRGKFYLFFFGFFDCKKNFNVQLENMVCRLSIDGMYIFYKMERLSNVKLYSFSMNHRRWSLIAYRSHKIKQKFAYFRCDLILRLHIFASMQIDRF